MAPVSRLQLGKFRETEKLGSIIKTIYHLDHHRPRSRSRSLESGGRQGGREIPFRFYEGGGGGEEGGRGCCECAHCPDWPTDMWLGRTVD